MPAGVQWQGGFIEYGAVEACGKGCTFEQEDYLPFCDTLAYCNSVERAPWQAALGDFGALKGETDEVGFTVARYSAVTVLHSGQRCPDTFSYSSEADEVQASALVGVGTDDAVVTFEAPGRNHVFS